MRQPQEAWEWPKDLPIVRASYRYQRYFVEDRVSLGRWNVQAYRTLEGAVRRFKEVIRGNHA